MRKGKLIIEGFELMDVCDNLHCRFEVLFVLTICYSVTFLFVVFYVCLFVVCLYVWSY